jgi:hypothetical protein
MKKPQWVVPSKVGALFAAPGTDCARPLKAAQRAPARIVPSHTPVNTSRQARDARSFLRLSLFLYTMLFFTKTLTSSQKNLPLKDPTPLPREREKETLACS